MLILNNTRGIGKKDMGGVIVMKRILALLISLSLYSMPAYGEPKDTERAQKPISSTEATPGNIPLGLAKKEKLPPGLAKQEKTPYGWQKGKKKGWGKEVEVKKKKGK